MICEATCRQRSSGNGSAEKFPAPPLRLGRRVLKYIFGTLAVGRYSRFRNETKTFPVAPPCHDRVYAVIPKEPMATPESPARVPGQARSQQAIRKTQVDQHAQRAGSEKCDQSASQRPSFESAITERNHVIQKEINSMAPSVATTCPCENAAVSKKWKSPRIDK